MMSVELLLTALLHAFGDLLVQLHAPAQHPRRLLYTGGALSLGRVRARPASTTADPIDVDPELADVAGNVISVNLTIGEMLLT